MRLLALLPAALALAACGGGPPADLFVVQRSGTGPGARLTLRITDDGGAYCNRIGRREISSAQLIEAREIRRELDGDPANDVKGLAERGLRLGPSGPTIFSFRVRSEKGVFVFRDTSRGYDTVPRILKLTHDIARGPCSLPR